MRFLHPCLELFIFLQVNIISLVYCGDLPAFLEDVFLQYSISTQSYNRNNSKNINSFLIARFLVY